MVGTNILNSIDNGAYDILSPSSRDLNLLDIQNVNDYLSRHNPEMIIHCAGIVGGIQANISNPVKFFVDNMQIGINIITSARELKIKKFMNLGSSCMYPRDAINPLSEDMISKGELEPTNEGYAIAKVASTKLCEYINKEDNSYLYKTIIPCNLYGKYDKFDPESSHMIPAVIRKISIAKNQNKKNIAIWGDGQSRREFMYAGDFANFVSFALKNFNALPQNLNVGLGFDFTIHEYYKKIAKIVGYDGNFTFDLSKPTGMKQKLIDDTKLKALGWTHSISLDEGLKRTYKYFVKNEVNNE